MSVTLYLSMMKIILGYSGMIGTADDGVIREATDRTQFGCNLTLLKRPIQRIYFFMRSVAILEAHV